MNSSTEKGMACFGAVILVVVLLVLAVAGSVLINAWAAMTVWNWFVPHFFGFEQLTMQTAIVISLVVSAFFHFESGRETPKYDSTGAAIAGVLGRITFKPLFLVFMAWIIKLIIL